MVEMFNRKTWFFVLLAAIFLNSAMGQSNVTGIVIDDFGNHVTSAQVSYSGGSNLTDLSGNYTIAEVSDGTYDFTASKAGYTSNITSITVSGADVTINFTLIHTGWADAIASISWGTSEMGFIFSKAAIFIETAVYLGIILVIVTLIGIVFKVALSIF